jgi:hypothetical protein
MTYPSGERRKWGRYRVQWPVRASFLSPSGVRMEEVGQLDNISARGALARFANSLPIDAEVRLSVKLPYSRDVWIAMNGRVLRSEPASQDVNVAIKFDSSKPDFI